MKDHCSFIFLQQMFKYKCEKKPSL